MTNTTEHYTDLIEPQHADKPRFVATVALTADVYARLQAFIASIPAAFDLDTAVGVQLDIDGQWIGRSRSISYQITPPWFAFGSETHGWGRGLWHNPYATAVGHYLLDDETYRRLLRAKVRANSWDGTLDGEQAILDTYFTDPATHVFVIDEAAAVPEPKYFAFGDANRGWGQGTWKPEGIDSVKTVTTVQMRMLVAVSGKIPNFYDLSILANDLAIAKPEGVEVKKIVTSVDGAPVFGFGANNSFIGGWGTGSWGVDPSYFDVNA